MKNTQDVDKDSLKQDQQMFFSVTFVKNQKTCPFFQVIKKVRIQPLRIPHHHNQFIPPRHLYLHIVHLVPG